MKYLLLILFILTAGKTFGQLRSDQIRSMNDTVKKYQDAHAPVIKANEAYKYIGRMVIVKDTLYSNKIINDNTVACEMGKKENTPRLTLYYTDMIDKRADERFFNTFKKARVSIWGTISGTKNAPIIILHGLETNFAFDANMHGSPRR